LPEKSDTAMYERFTDRARKVLQLANQEAQRFKCEYIGTEHILLGLVNEGSGVAANVLKNLDINLQKIRREVETIIQPGQYSTILAKRPETPRAKKVIEYAIEEARKLTHHYVGTEHLLLGLLREDEGVAAQVLMNLGLRLDMVHEEVLVLLGQQPLPVSGEDVQKMERGSEDSFQDEGAGIQHLPEEAQLAIAAFDQLINQLQDCKEEAVAGAEFDKAAIIRDQEDQLKKARARFIYLWSKPK